MPTLRFETYVFAAVALVIGFLVVYPVGMMLGGTFLTEQGEFTLVHWRKIWDTPVLLEGLRNTLFVTLSSTALGVLFGLGLAIIVSRTDTPMRGYFEFISILPFVTPPIIAGLAWQILADGQSGVLNMIFDALNIPVRVNVMSISGVIFVTTLFLIPFVFLITNGILRSINPELEEASSVCGAGRFTTFLRITVPLLMPGITSAALLAFMYSNIVFGIHATLGMPVNIWFLTTLIYQSLNVYPIDWNQAAILAFFLMVFGAAATYLQIRILGRASYATITGKGFRSKIVSLGGWRWVTWGLCVTYIFVVAILPYMILFLRSMSPYMFQPGITFLDIFSNWQFDKYYTILLGEDNVSRRSIRNSFLLALAAATTVMVLTGVAAYILTKTKTWGKQVLNFLCMIPLALPGIVLGVAILWGYTRPEIMLYGTIWILLVAYVTKDLPLGLRSTHASFLQVHPELEEAARVCGAGWIRQLFNVTIPLVRPGLAIGFVLVFADILREVGASILLYSHGNEVVAYVLFNMWEDGRYQLLSAFIIITTFITLAVVAVILWLSRLRFVHLTRADVR